ncbi:MAG: hypothetical protein EPO24_05870 [Bacteroidetes bacterium]|nr:MAG: hypothetical protein EPO24_05870 [Bacteroidota bacterium]
MNKNLCSRLWRNTKGIDALRRHSNPRTAGYENISSQETSHANQKPPAKSTARQSRQTTNRVPTKNISHLLIALFAVTITLVMLSCNEPEVQIIEPPGPPPPMSLPDSIAVGNVLFIDTLNGWLPVWLFHETLPYQGGIFKTTDGGLTWYAKYLTTRARMSSVKFIDHQYGWAKEVQGSVIYTTDGGENWIRQDTIVFDIEGETGIRLNSFRFLNRCEGWGTASKSGCPLGCGGCGYVVHTTNGGRSWNMNYYSSNRQLAGVYMLPSGKGWVSGGGNYLDCPPYILHTSDYGGTWFEQQIPGDDIGTVSSFAFHNSNFGYAYGMRGIFKTSNSGQRWDTTAFSTATAYDMAIINDSVVYALRGSTITYLYTLYRSSNRGKTWNKQAEFGRSFKDMSFLNDTTGWIVGQVSYPTGFTVYRLRNNSWIKIR